MSTIWEDDFSSGNALAVSYTDVNDAETNATCGQAGGWGCRTTGTASQKYYGWFRYTPASPIASEYLRITVDLDHASASHDDVPGLLFALNDAAWGPFLYLYHGADTGDDKTVLWVQSAYETGDGPFSATGAITLASWQTIQMEVWFSTYAAGSPWAPNADGRVKVTVDGAIVIDSSTLKIQSHHTANDGTPNVTNSLDIGPMGNGDNLTLCDAPASMPWVDIPNWHAQESLDAAQYPGGVARCACELWTEDTGASPGPTITARLVSLLADGSVDAVVGTSAVISATVPTDATFAVTLTGNKPHKLQLTSDTPEIDLWCAPGAKVTV